MSAPLRVVEITKSTGGVGEYARWLARGLDPARFALTFICLSENGPELAAELRERYGGRTFSLSMNRYRIDPFSDARVLAWLARHLRQERYAVAHAHASKPGFLTRLAAAGTGLPVIYSPHAFAFHAGVHRAAALLVAALERAAAHWLTARIMTVSDGERELAQRYHVGRPEQFVTVHSGIDPAPFRGPVDRAAVRAALGVPGAAPVVGAVGRLSRQKAPLDFVRLAAVVRAQRPDARFVWIGSGPLEPAARALAQELGVAKAMYWAGQRQDVAACLRGLDCFVLASHWEGFPIVVLEAMAADAPVVATDIPGTRELIEPGQSGWLAPAGDIAGLARGVLAVLNNPAEADAFRAAGRRRIDTEFTPARMLAGVAGLYETLARRPAG